MELTEVHQRVELIGGPIDALDRTALRAALEDARCLRGWVEAQQARLTRRLTEVSPNPISDLATAGKTTQTQAMKGIDRAETIGQLPAFDLALSNGDVSERHVDLVGNALRDLKPDLRRQLEASADELADLASATTVDEFARLLRARVRQLEQHDGLELLDRQRKANRLKTWIDQESGMGRFAGALDPLSFVRFSQLISELTRSRSASGIDGPNDGPLDVREHHAWQQAMALVDLVDGKTGGRGRGPEITVVVDTRASDAEGRPMVDWGLPVEIPNEVLIAMLAGPSKGETTSDTDAPANRRARSAAWARSPGTTVAVVPVVLDGTNVIQAPGGMDHHRETRSATRDQRRVLRALYPTCAIPDCRASFARTDIHHVKEWWPDGLTNLDNLLPLCPYHHHKVHDDGWTLQLHPDRTLTIRFPDGSQMTTGPPSRGP